MNNKVLNKQFIRIVIPIAVQNLLTSLVSASDALMLGGLNQSVLYGTDISGIFCAGGDTKFGFICDTITMWLIVVPLGLCKKYYEGDSKL